MEFEWDPAKATSNLAKHGIEFRDATAVFDDPDVYITPDPRPYGEIRFQAIGIVKGRIGANRVDDPRWCLSNHQREKGKSS